MTPYYGSSRGPGRERLLLEVLHRGLARAESARCPAAADADQIAAVAAEETMHEHLLGRKVIYDDNEPVGTIRAVWWDDRARNLLVLIEKTDAYQWYWITSLHPA